MSSYQFRYNPFDPFVVSHNRESPHVVLNDDLFHSNGIMNIKLLFAVSLFAMCMCLVTSRVALAAETPPSCKFENTDVTYAGAAQMLELILGKADEWFDDNGKITHGQLKLLIDMLYVSNFKTLAKYYDALKFWIEHFDYIDKNGGDTPKDDKTISVIDVRNAINLLYVADARCRMKPGDVELSCGKRCCLCTYYKSDDLECAKISKDDCSPTNQALVAKNLGCHWTAGQKCVSLGHDRCQNWTKGMENRDISLPDCQVRESSTFEDLINGDPLKMLPGFKDNGCTDFGLVTGDHSGPISGGILARRFISVCVISNPACFQPIGDPNKGLKPGVGRITMQDFGCQAFSDVEKAQKYMDQFIAKVGADKVTVEWSGNKLFSRFRCDSPIVGALVGSSKATIIYTPDSQCKGSTSVIKYPTCDELLVSGGVKGNQCTESEIGTTVPCMENGVQSSLKCCKSRTSDSPMLRRASECAV